MALTNQRKGLASTRRSLRTPLREAISWGVGVTLLLWLGFY